eukprot:Gb_08929 [translate_table: standard]
MDCGTKTKPAFFHGYLLQHHVFIGSFLPYSFIACSSFDITPVAASTVCTFALSNCHTLGAHVFGSRAFRHHQYCSFFCLTLKQAYGVQSPLMGASEDQATEHLVVSFESFSSVPLGPLSCPAHDTWEI